MNHRERDWAIKITDLEGSGGEEVWKRTVIGSRTSTKIIWDEVAFTICEVLYLAEEVEWIVMDDCRAMIVCSCEAEARNLTKKDIFMSERGRVVFDEWNSEAFSIGYDKLFKDRWVRVCGLLFNLWNYRILESIGDLCGGLISVNVKTLKCEELRWA